MDKEILRKQVFDEIHAQFESKLRESKRQKSQVEAELESASERWRAERRRLNSEIDRLETAVADAKESKKRAASKGGPVVDPAEIARIQASAEEKFAKAEQEWQTERGDMKKEVARLERAIAELLERSNNPLRRSAAATDRLQSEAEGAKREADGAKRESETAKREKQQVEEEFRRAQLAWEEEFRSAQNAWEEERKKLAASSKGERELKKAQADWEAERKELKAESSKLVTEIDKLRAEINRLREESATLKRQAEQSAAQSSEHESSSSAIADQLREALQERNFLKQQLQAANEAVQSKRTMHSEEIAALEKQITLLEEDLERERSERANAPAAAATFVASATAANGSDDKALQGEIQRIESMIADINRLIDDPSCELSTVIRKNVERAELDAYLKGIFFSIGQAKGM
jgi:chromosome segregation ATPase